MHLYIDNDAPVHYCRVALRRSASSTTSRGVPQPEFQEFHERLAAVMRCFKTAAEEAYTTLDLGSAQARMVRHLGDHGGISQAELARATATAPTLTGRALETLLERGWVRRKRSAADGREYLLELTADGRRMRAQVVKAQNGLLDRVEAVLDERDVKDFGRIAGKILAVFDR